MAKIDQLKEEVSRNWGEHPACRACIRIIDYMHALPEDELSMLTFTSLKNAAGEQEINQRIVDAVTLLSSTSIHALDTHLLFIDDDEQEFEIPKGELAEARREGVFIHPNTGEPVADFEAKIIPFFVPSKRFLSFRDRLVAKRDFTVAELLARAAGRPGAEIIIDLLLMPDYAEFVRIVNRTIDLRRMAENPELRKDRTEDELTIELVGLLRQLDIDAHHEAKVGGHCDITIRGHSDYMWLAEAKRDNQTLDWLLQGFQQLNTRYSTGLKEHDHGAMILYLYSADTLSRMKTWQEHLGASLRGITFSPCDRNPLSFNSTHTHERSGLPYNVRHIPLSLYFAPKDKVAKSARKRTPKSSPSRSRRK
jgi:hypothetical protein